MTAFQHMSHSLRRLYLEEKRPWLVGFSGGTAVRLLDVHGG
jgi:hypothetical protein